MQLNNLKERFLKIWTIPALIVLSGLLLNIAFTLTPTTTEAVYGGPEEIELTFQTPEEAALASSDLITDSEDSIEDEPAGPLAGDSVSLEFVGPFGPVTSGSQVPSPVITATNTGPGGVSRANYLPKGCIWGATGRFTGGAHGRYNGQDTADEEGTPIVASCNGIVKRVDDGGWNGGYGTRIIISHDGFDTLYAHLSEVLVVEGQPVSQGEIIGEMGSTGKSTGSHLHFEVRVH